MPGGQTPSADGGPGDQRAPLQGDQRAALQQVYNEVAPAFAKVTSAYQCELAASMMLGQVYRWASGNRIEGVSGYGDLLARHAGQHRNRQAAALLAGLGAVAPGGAAETARAGLRRLARRKVSIPGWAGQVSLVTCSSVWELKDVFGDRSQYIIAFDYQDPERAAGPDHAVWVRINHNQGVVEELSVLSPASVMVEGARNTDVPGVKVSQADPAAVRAELLDAVPRTDLLDQPPGGEQYVNQWAFLLARVASLPDGGAGGRPPSLPEDVRVKLVDDFVTALGGALVQPEGPVPVETAKLAARLAIDYAVEANSGNPLRWSPAAVEHFLTRWLPRQEEQTELWLAEVLGALVVYAGRLSRLPPEAVRATVERVADCWQYRQSLAEARLDESNHDMYGRMVIAGVDFQDDAAVRRWMSDYVDAQDAAAEPDRRDD